MLESLFTSSGNRIISQPNISKISAADAANYIGKNVVVCAQVYGVKELPTVNFINLGAAHPNSPLTIVISAADKGNFKRGPYRV